MTYQEQGYLITDKRSSGDSIKRTTQEDWENYQEKESVDIPADYIRLARITLIEDFEHNDLGGVYDLRGHDSVWDIQSSVVYQGDYALWSDSTSGDFIQATNDSLPAGQRTPEVDETFEVYFRSDGNDNRAYFDYFKAPSAGVNDDCFELTYLTNSDSFRLRTRDPDEDIFQETLSETVTNEFIRIELTHEEDGTINAVCEKLDGTTLASASANYDPYTHDPGGAIEWGSRNTSTGLDNYYGYAEIVEPSDPPEASYDTEQLATKDGSTLNSNTW